MSRTTQSYAALPFGERIETLANGPSADECPFDNGDGPCHGCREQKYRETPVQDVFDDMGVWAGRLIWRAELDAWCGADSAHHLPLRRGTYEQAKRLILRRVACSTRVEAKAVK